MATLQDEESPIDREIVTELVAATPGSWRRVALEVTYSNDGSVERYGHAISSPEGHRELVTPSQTIFDATYRLGRVFLKYGKHWKKAKYLVRVNDDGTMCYAVDFEY